MYINAMAIYSPVDAARKYVAKYRQLCTAERITRLKRSVLAMSMPRISVSQTQSTRTTSRISINSSLTWVMGQLPIRLRTALYGSGSFLMGLVTTKRITHHQWRAFFGLTRGIQDAPYPGGGRLEDAYWRTVTRQMHKPWDLQLGDQIWISRDMIEACIKWFAGPEAAPLGSQEQFRLYHRGLSASEVDHLFKTARGYMGVSQGPTVPKVGDQVFLLAGASMPFVLRACEISACNTRFQLVCESYVHGVMERRGVSVEEAATELEERLGNSVLWL
ncbi:hypothetical protein GJ744_001381 [Endocarpon pusillum]|uniref:Uncharacterized protein n=1 Tax=Endocarpon pusillum TaxID=364733 RepID=A0A8H7ASN8_9EURO|nr:hypothetical protein GJ744_001381 [Endocarpon pusillum]